MKAKALEDWLERWDSRQNGRKYIGTPTRRVGEPQGSIQKLEAARLTQLRTGHGYFNSYLSRIPTSNVETTACPCGSRIQTPEHLILRCSRFNRPRNSLKKELGGGIPLKMSTALYTPRGVKATLKYLQVTQVGLRPQVRETLQRRPTQQRS